MNAGLDIALGPADAARLGQDHLTMTPREVRRIMALDEDLAGGLREMLRKTRFEYRRWTVKQMTDLCRLCSVTFPDMRSKNRLHASMEAAGGADWWADKLARLIDLREVVESAVARIVDQQVHDAAVVDISDPSLVRELMESAEDRGALFGVLAGRAMVHDSVGAARVLREYADQVERVVDSHRSVVADLCCEREDMPPEWRASREVLQALGPLAASRLEIVDDVCGEEAGKWLPDAQSTRRDGLRA